MFGLPGPTLRDEDVSLFKETRAAGLIVVRRNFDSPAGLLRLLGSLEGALGRRLLVATDHEGGRVVMLGGATTIFPDNLAGGTAGEEAFAHRQGIVEARELRSLGVDLNLAPVLDVLTERYSPNVGIRSYGKDPTVVSRYGAARIRGMKRGGASACAKHFPGKGHAPLDAHLALPTIESTWAEMRETHLPPFLEAIAAGVDCVMTSHPVYPNLDPARVPATFSRPIVEDCLRNQLCSGSVTVVFPRFSELCPGITIEPEVANERAYLEGAFASVGIAPAVLLVGIEPTGDEIGAAAERAAVADATVLFLYDAHLFASNRALLEAVEARARALAVVLLRDPYDAALLTPGILGITAYGFRKCQLDAVIARLAYP